VALLVVDSEHGVKQGDAQMPSYAEEVRTVSHHRDETKWDLAAQPRGKAAPGDAATTKGRAKAGLMRNTNSMMWDKGNADFRLRKNGARQTEIFE